MAKDNINHVNTGGGAYVGGSVNIKSGKFVGRDDYSSSNADNDSEKQMLDSFLAQVNKNASLTKDDKADLKQEIVELMEELSKKAQADETFLLRRLRNIKRMAPDILETIIATITSPIAGFGVIAKKIAEKISKGTV